MDYRRALLCCAFVVACVSANPTGAKKEKSIRSKIVGGKAIDIGSASYTVSINNYIGGHFCGGSIIHPQFILTAAHCIDAVRAHNIYVRSGSTWTNKGGESTPVARIIKHPRYNPDTVNNDIALLVLQKPIHSGRMVRLARREPAVGKNGLYSGYGVTHESNTTPSTTLRAAWVPVIDRATCHEIYDGTNGITGSMICAGYKQGGIDACQGDSGGPYVIDDEQVGIVSWGRGCARQGKPGVLANVAAFIPWISKYVPLN